MCKTDMIRPPLRRGAQRPNNSNIVFCRSQIFSGFSLMVGILITSFSGQQSLIAQDTVSQFNLDEELKKLEESEKEILSSLSGLQPASYEDSKDRNQGSSRKLSHDAVIPDSINREIMPDTAVSGIGSTSEPGVGSSLSHMSEMPANSKDLTTDSVSAAPVKHPGEAGFKELGGIASGELEKQDRVRPSTMSSSDGASAEQNKSGKPAGTSASKKDERANTESDKTKGIKESLQQQALATNVSSSLKDKDLDKEVARLHAIIESKEQEIKKLRVNESNLKSKLKLYEDEIRRLSDALDELNRNVVLGKCPSYSANVTAARSNFDPTAYYPDGPVPLISVQAGTVVYSGPSRNSIPIMTLNEDTSVPKIDSENDWVRIIAPNGVKGWIYRPGSSSRSVASIEQKALDNWVMVGRD